MDRISNEGRIAALSAGQHVVDTDSKGNLFTCDLFMPQKFMPKNLPTRTPSGR